MKTGTTQMTTNNGETIYFFGEGNGCFDPIAVAGPWGFHLTDIDLDDLPEGFRMVDADEFFALCAVFGLDI